MPSDQSPGSGIENYELQVSTDNNFLYVAYSSITVDVIVKDVILPPQKYYWRVGAKDKAGNYSDWFSVYTFTIWGEPKKIALSLEKTQLKADGIDSSKIVASILDENENLVGDAENLITFFVNEHGVLIGANPQSSIKGIAEILVRSTKSSGTILVEAYSIGLSTGRDYKLLRRCTNKDYFRSVYKNTCC